MLLFVRARLLLLREIEQPPRWRSFYDLDSDAIGASQKPPLASHWHGVRVKIFNDSVGI